MQLDVCYTSFGCFWMLLGTGLPTRLPLLRRLVYTSMSMERGVPGVALYETTTTACFSFSLLR